MQTLESPRVWMIATCLVAKYIARGSKSPCSFYHWEVSVKPQGSSSSLLAPQLDLTILYDRMLPTSSLYP